MNPTLKRGAINLCAYVAFLEGYGPNREKNEAPGLHCS
jgi:hypothetical protein